MMADRTHTADAAPAAPGTPTSAPGGVGTIPGASETALREGPRRLPARTPRTAEGGEGEGSLPGAPRYAVHLFSTGERVSLPGDDCTGRRPRPLRLRFLSLTGMSPEEWRRHGFTVRRLAAPVSPGLLNRVRATTRNAALAPLR
jgi:hypothetical protein